MRAKKREGEKEDWRDADTILYFFLWSASSARIWRINFMQVLQIRRMSSVNREYQDRNELTN